MCKPIAFRAFLVDSGQFLNPFRAFVLSRAHSPPTWARKLKQVQDSDVELMNTPE